MRDGTDCSPQFGIFHTRQAPFGLSCEINPLTAIAEAAATHAVTAAVLALLDAPHGGDISAVIAFLTEHFQEGSVSPGDQDEPTAWQPIASVASFLHEFAKTGNRDYPGVTVRKA